MTLILDAGALIAVDRGDRQVLALLKSDLVARRTPTTHGGVVGQVWRSSRQANLARLLAGTDVVGLDGALGRAAGMLLAATGTSDVVDAALVALCQDGDLVLTSDPDDIAVLAAAADLHVEVAAV